MTRTDIEIVGLSDCHTNVLNKSRGKGEQNNSILMITIHNNAIIIIIILLYYYHLPHDAKYNDRQNA